MDRFKFKFKYTNSKVKRKTKPIDRMEMVMETVINQMMDGNKPRTI